MDLKGDFNYGTERKFPKAIFYFVKEHEAENITAQDIADALGLGVKQVNGSVTSAFCRKDLMTRVEAEKDTRRRFSPEGKVYQAYRPWSFL